MRLVKIVGRDRFDKRRSFLNLSSYAIPTPIYRIGAEPKNAFEKKKLETEKMNGLPQKTTFILVDEILHLDLCTVPFFLIYYVLQEQSDRNTITETL